MFDNSGNLDEDTMLDNADDESGAAFLIRILKYLETPQYLRKALFPMHNSLRFVVCLFQSDAPFLPLTAFLILLRLLVRAYLCCTLQGLLPPLDAPHHLRKHEWGSYREGRPSCSSRISNVIIDQKCIIF